MVSAICVNKICSHVEIIRRSKQAAYSQVLYTQVFIFSSNYYLHLLTRSFSCVNCFLLSCLRGGGGGGCDGGGGRLPVREGTPVLVLWGTPFPGNTNHRTGVSIPERTWDQGRIRCHGIPHPLWTDKRLTKQVLSVVFLFV